jgi:hypothetical protein
MRPLAPTPLDQRRRHLRTSDEVAGLPHGRTRRRPVRPLDDGTTELVHLIEFVLPVGDAVQPVVFLERQLLD